MHYCGMGRDEIMFELPYSHGLQLIHAALLSQGARCVRPADAQRKIDQAREQRERILQRIQNATTDYDDEY